MQPILFLLVKFLKSKVGLITYWRFLFVVFESLIVCLFIFV